MASYFLGKHEGKATEPAREAPPVVQHPTEVLHPQPVPGIRMRPPETTPTPGQVIIGYQVIKPQSGRKMAAGVAGGTALGICSILIFPCCLPCAVASCIVPALQSRMYQAPVYGWPGEAPALTQVDAAPVTGQPVNTEAAGGGVAAVPPAALPIGVAVVPAPPSPLASGLAAAPAPAAPAALAGATSQVVV